MKERSLILSGKTTQNKCKGREGGEEGRENGKEAVSQNTTHIQMSACQPSGKDKGLSEGTEKECVGFKTQREC